MPYSNPTNCDFAAQLQRIKLVVSFHFLIIFILITQSACSQVLAQCLRARLCPVRVARFWFSPYLCDLLLTVRYSAPRILWIEIPLRYTTGTGRKQALNARVNECQGLLNSLRSRADRSDWIDLPLTWLNLNQDCIMPTPFNWNFHSMMSWRLKLNSTIPSRGPITVNHLWSSHYCWMGQTLSLDWSIFV